MVFLRMVICGVICGGSASGVNGTEAAALHAINHPMLGQRRLQQASAVLIAVRAPPGVLMLGDSMSAMRSIRKQLSQDPWIIYGTYYEAHLNNEITVSVLSSGIRDV